MELYYETSLSRRKIGDPKDDKETYDLIYLTLKELKYRPYRIQVYSSSDLQLTYYDFDHPNERFVRVNDLINLISL